MSEIKVNHLSLSECESELSNLSQLLSDNTLSLDFANSQGAVVDEIINTAEILNSIGSALSELVNKTKTVVANARIEFETAENTSSSQWRN